jgi:hypothetical protein
MKNLIAFCLFVFSLTGQAQTDTVTTTSALKAVTVFFKGAEITREFNAQLTAGTTVLLIESLPFGLNAAGIGLKPKEGLDVLSFQVKSQDGLSFKKSAQIKKMEDSLKGAEESLRLLQAEKQVLAAEQKLLVENARFYGDEQGAKMTEIREMADYYRQRLLGIAQKQIQLDRNITILEKRLLDWSAKIQEKTALLQRPSSSLLVKVRTTKPGKFYCGLTYVVENAGWNPVYRFRVQELDQPMDIDYYAQVYQTTGEDWRQVELTVTSGAPSETRALPEFKPWLVGQPKPYPIPTPSAGEGKMRIVLVDPDQQPLPFASVRLLQNQKLVAGNVSDASGQLMFRGLMPGHYMLEVQSIGYEPLLTQVYLQPNQEALAYHTLLPAARELMEIAIAYESETLSSRKKREEARPQSHFVDGVTIRGARSQGNVILSDQATAETPEPPFVSFELKEKTDIPSDGQNHEVHLKSVSHPARYVHFAAPGIRPEVYLTAELEQWQKLQLLPGKARIAIQQNFNGEIFFDPLTMGDTFRISLGPDPSVLVSRQLAQKTNQKVFLSQQAKKDYQYLYTVRNNRSTPIQLLLKDQVPLATQTQEEVVIEQLSGGQHEKMTGVITWVLALPEKSNLQKNLHFVVRYPKR